MSTSSLSDDRQNQFLAEIHEWLSHSYDNIFHDEDNCFLEILFPIPETELLHIYIRVVNELRVELDARHIEVPCGEATKVDEWKSRIKSRRRFYFAKRGDKEFVMIEFPVQFNAIRQTSDQARLIRGIGEIVTNQYTYYLDDLKAAVDLGLKEC